MISYMIDINDVTEDMLDFITSEFPTREYVIRDDFSFKTVTIQSANLNVIQSLITQFGLDVRIYNTETGQFIK